MTAEPRAFLALDLGSATHSASLIGWVHGRWRLLGNLAVPAAIAIEPAVDLLVGRLRAADASLSAHLLPDEAEALPRLTVRTGPAPRLAVVAATDRGVAELATAARLAGWSVSSASVESGDPLVMTRLLLRPDVGTVLAGASDPPGGDERASIADLAAVVGAAAGRRPELGVVLAGGMAAEADAIRRPSPEPDSPSEAATPAGDEADGAVVLAPAATAGEPRGEALRTLLEAMRAGPDDGRAALARATGSLAEVLGRLVETVDVGYGSSTRVVASPGVGGEPGTVRSFTIADAALVPVDVRDDVVDGVLGWATVPFDRHRMRDRLRELRMFPWAEAHGEGAQLRLAAARAALTRLAAATSAAAPPRAPDLLVAAGGAWAVAPGPAIALAMVDGLRRSGTSVLAHDHARLLGPIGAIEDPRERRTIVGDLANDAFIPLGSVIVPSGLRAGRSAGRMTVHGAAGSSELDLVPGGLELVDLPPGESAVAELEFRDTVTLGAHGRSFAVNVGGGLGGLLIDLRDVPLRLPDRHERRRELLAAWQRALWAGIDT